MQVVVVVGLDTKLLHLVAQVELVVVAMVHPILLRAGVRVQPTRVVAVAVLQVLFQQAATAAPALSSSSTTSHHRLYSPSSHRPSGLLQQV
jgi:hypothetical protein